MPLNLTNRLVPLLLLLCLAAIPLPLTAGSEQSWFDDDSAERALAVNEGQLEFIGDADAAGMLQSDSRLRLGPDSAAHGWVDLQQCYRNLDPVPATEIVYAYREMEQLRVLRTVGIGRVEIGQQSIELDDVSRGAEVCVSAKVRILIPRDGGGYLLRNGPYHRRFFDGYYPYQVKLQIEFAASGLVPTKVSPAPQPGFEVSRNPGSLAIETRFEGVLTISIEFDES